MFLQFRLPPYEIVFMMGWLHEVKEAAAQEVGLPSGVVKPRVGVGDSLNLALRLS